MIRLELRGLHPDQLPRLTTILGQLDREYPGALRAVRTYSSAGDESLANEEAGVVSLNLHWFGRPLMVLQEAALRGNLTRHGVADVAPWHDHLREPDHLLSHEFAHCLRSLRGSRAADFAREGHRRALEEPALAATGYALVDPEEWWAETFAVMRYGREHAWTNPQAQELRAFLSEQ